MKLSKYFFIVFLLLSTLSVIPYFMTKDRPNVDGQAKIGFPLNFYSYGGETINGSMGRSFSLRNLILDIFFILVVSLVINFIIRKQSHRESAILNS